MMLHMRLRKQETIFYTLNLELKNGKSSFPLCSSGKSSAKLKAHSSHFVWRNFWVSAPSWREARNPDFFLFTVCSVWKKSAVSNPVILQITESWLKKDKTWLFSIFPLAEHYGRFLSICPFIAKFNFWNFSFFHWGIHHIQNEFFMIEWKMYCPGSIFWRAFRSIGFAVSIKLMFNKWNQSILFQFSHFTKTFRNLLL